MAAPSDSEDDLDDVGRQEADSDDEVVSTLQRKELTQLPSAEVEEEETEAAAEPENLSPSVMMVDPGWHDVKIHVKELTKPIVWQIPSDLLLHAPMVSRSGGELTRIEMSFEKFCEQSTQRAAVAKAMVNELGGNYVASRLIFAKIAARPNGAVAMLPVKLTGVEDSLVAQELEKDGAVACFLFPSSEVQALLKPSSSSTSTIPREFSRNNGKYDMSPPPFSREGPLSWSRITSKSDQKPKAAPKAKAKTLLLPDPMPVLEPPAKKARAEASTSTAPPRPPPPRPLPPPPRESTTLVLKRPETTIPDVEFEGLRKQAERREQTFLLEPDVKERRIPIPVPAGVSAKITVEFILNA